jgi:hypothetical protein
MIYLECQHGDEEEYQQLQRGGDTISQEVLDTHEDTTAYLDTVDGKI